MYILSNQDNKPKKIDLIKILVYLFHYLGLNKFFFYLNRNRKKILVYHNIIPDSLVDHCIDASESVSEKSFIQQINQINKRFLFSTELQNNKTVTLTFDDGFLNQYSIVSKYLFKKSISAYFFITLQPLLDNKSNLIDKLVLWISFAEQGSYLISLTNGTQFDLTLHEVGKRHESWKQVIKLVYNNQVNFEDIEKQLTTITPIETVVKSLDKIYYKERFTYITSEQLTEMKQNSHLIGAHSHKHPIFSFTKHEEVKNEIKSCEDEIGAIYNTDVYCYPFGGTAEVDEKSIETLKLSRFKFGIANCNYNLKNGLHYSRHFIPRIQLPDTSDTKAIDFYLSGSFHFLKHKQLFPKWQ